MRHHLLSLLLVLVFTPLVVSAQVSANLNLTPKSPAPYENVTLTLGSYSFDVNTAMITWKVSGKTTLSGMGKKSLTLSLGGVGQEVPVTVQATTADGTSVTQSITVSPQSVDLLYEGVESYVPPFYEGRSLAAEGAMVRVVALPTMAERGEKVPASGLSYSWYVNDSFVDNVSGFGRSNVKLALDSLSDSTKVRVLVRTPLGNTAEKELTIYPHAVLPFLYKYDELLGTDFSRNLLKRLELSSDITLSLEPFFLSTRRMESTAKYEWFIDGLPVTPQEKTVLSLRPKENSYGSRYLTVALEQTKRMAQKAETTLQVIFDTRK